MRWLTGKAHLGQWGKASLSQKRFCVGLGDARRSQPRKGRGFFLWRNKQGVKAEKEMALIRL